MDNKERLIIEHCKTLPCFGCVVRPICFSNLMEVLTTDKDDKPEKSCGEYDEWLSNRDVLILEWEGFSNRAMISSIKAQFKQSIKEMEKEKI